MIRKRFSERYGFKQPREAFQIDDMDNALRNRLWNKFREFYLDKLDWNLHERDYNFFVQIYDEFFKLAKKPIYNLTDIANKLFRLFFKLEWFEVYDFIEYVAHAYYDKGITSYFRTAVNKVLEEEMSAYRFVGEYIAPIIDEVEINEIEEVLNGRYEPVKRHLSIALELLSDRKNPDYVNSIKESITAVEAMCQIITKTKADLGKCLKKMKLNLNEHFRKGLTELYDWTNNEDGIRHAHTKDELVTSFVEAKFMLVICSALINYLIAKYEN